MCPGLVFESFKFGQKLDDAQGRVSGLGGEGRSVSARFQFLLFAVARREDANWQPGYLSECPQMAQMRLCLNASGQCPRSICSISCPGTAAGAFSLCIDLSKPSPTKIWPPSV
jgi:hypothetical protein